VELGKDLEILEKQLRQLQIDWEKFFGGVEKKPPVDLRSKVEALIRRYAGIEIRNNQERFRYQTLTARYNTFNELWSKRLRALEEGRVAGLHVTRAMKVAVPPPPEPEPAAAAPTPAAAAARARAAAPAPGSKEYRIQNPEGDGTMVRALFRQFVDERKRTGEMAAVSYENFERLISQQATKILTEKGAQAVDFRIENKDGKVSLKAKPVK
jgi:hypothetical protein